MCVSEMDLGQRISNVAARIGVEKPEGLQLNTLYTIIHASRPPCFPSTVDLLLYTPENNDVAFLFLSKEFSDVFTDEDNEDINRHQYEYYLVCRK
jgi:hypothetical protein